MPTYIHDLGLLFEDVQTKSIFPDNKTFPDCLPKADLLEIQARYLAEREQPCFDLKTFVSEYFDLPQNNAPDYYSNTHQSAEEHLETLWQVLTRESKTEHSSLIPLPHPYMVPGGRFREIYYWDSYFTMLGLQISGRTEMIRSMVDNFSYLLDTIGHIPNGNRAYYVGRSQPPFFSLMVKLLGKNNEKQILAEYLPQLLKEYWFWMDGFDDLTPENNVIHRVIRMPNGAVLNRYWDNHDTPRPESFKEDLELSHQSEQNPANLFRNLRAAAESGWDFSSRWFREAHDFSTIHTTDIIPIDLNCLLSHLEDILAETYTLNDEPQRATIFRAFAQRRKSAIQQYCWNEAKGFYFDYDFVADTPKNHYSLAAVFPLYFGIASQSQAKSVADTLEDKFLKINGLVTTLEETGQQWDAPNGWAPLHWMAYRGLLNYGFTELAQTIRKRWVSLNLQVYAATGKMTEKYNVQDENTEGAGGEYPNQDGFGWTNGVLLSMLKEK